jgi:hypothetical protein
VDIAVFKLTCPSKRNEKTHAPNLVAPRSLDAIRAVAKAVESRPRE